MALFTKGNVNANSIFRYRCAHNGVLYKTVTSLVHNAIVENESKVCDRFGEIDYDEVSKLVRETFITRCTSFHCLLELNQVFAKGDINSSTYVKFECPLRQLV